ncbi:MAG: hypothetical protein OQL11_00195 [Gammaproteobacteria bacterium]|nr:hypothetical protein [Gammaproteobacteria bacterium]
MKSTEINLEYSSSTAAKDLRFLSRQPFIKKWHAGNSSIDVSIREGSADSVFEIEAKTHLISTPLGKLTGSFQMLQLWEGYVVSVSDEEMLCRIFDKTNEENPVEEVSIPLKEVEPAELPLVYAGSVFYWSIRYADQRGRGRARESLIRFRRLPPISVTSIEKSKARANYLEQFFSEAK